jgi:hypothetical protein
MSEPRERPILFSAPMVRAILDGSKTQTRRVIPERTLDKLTMHEPHLMDAVRDCKYGAVGDRLWVRETWRNFGGREYEYQHEQRSVIYRADAEPIHNIAGEWRPSIFMPRWASRITLEITRVTVERLQKITESDAVAEGVKPLLGDSWEPGKVSVVCSAAEEYARLWDSINGKGSWEKNPWVWVIEFKKAVQP